MNRKKMDTLPLRLSRIVCCLFFLLLPLPAAAETGGRHAWLLENPDGKILAALNADENMIPASILKILTSLYALETLGIEYRIATPWTLDAEGCLVFTAKADPLLTSIPLKAMVARLADEIPHRNFTGFVVDVSRFEKKLPVDGRSSSSLRSYNAPLSAFAVNFNSVSFKNEKGKLVSGEEETPLLPMVLGPIQASRMASGRIALPEEEDFPMHYAAALTRHFLEEAGFSFKKKDHILRTSPSEISETLLLEIPSPFTIGDIVHQLMAYSNNVVANQLLLFTVSRNRSSLEPVGLEEARKALSAFAEKHLKIRNLNLEEGSGLSLRNDISPRDMMKILHAFAPYMSLMRREKEGWYKTGTLSQVRTRAGYLQGAGGWYPYVLMTEMENDIYPKHLEFLKKMVKSQHR